MKTVFLVRHAKSSWKEESLIDLDRPLRPKGISDAVRSASKMIDKGAYPDHIITSPAIRATHTALIFARQFEYPVHRIEMNESLYENGEEGIVEILQNLSNELDAVMVVSHDPALTNLTNSYTSKQKEKFPTSSVLCLKFKMKDWKLLQERKPRLSFFISNRSKD